jgi:dTDP-glucose 4,6-dehydratase
MRVLVTGGCGFVGSAVVRLAVERGDHVLNVDRRGRAIAVPALVPISAREGYARLEADASDRAMMRAVIRQFAPDAVIHLAATPDAAGDTLMDGELGCAYAVLEACRAYRDGLSGDANDRFRIVHAEQAEGDGVRPSRAQAARSAAAALMERWANACELPLVTCVAGEAFGPWQPQSSLMANLVSHLMHDRPFAIPDGGEIVRDWLPVRDLAAGLLLAAEAGPPLSRIDLSVGAERRDIDIAESVCSLLDERIPRHNGQWMDLVSGEGTPAISSGPMLDQMDAEHVLRWQPQGFHAGLDRLLSWALASRAASQARTLAVAAE